MRLTVLSGFVPLLGLLAVADEPKTPAEKFQALVKAQQKAQKDFSDAYQAAKTDADRQKVSKELGRQSMPDSHAGAFLALMKEHPKDPVTLDALRWLATRAQYTPEAAQAVDAVLRDWIDDARLKRVCEPMHFSTPTIDRLLRGVIEKSPHREVQGFAHYSLAQSLKWNADRLADHPAAEREPLEKEADQLLQKVIDRHADLKHFTTLGEEAEQVRFELRHLGLGKTPPDIEGEDLDGRKLKLSDFRGKVTLVVFWASWCGPCMGDVPHERELLKRYEGKPFAIVGINGDKDRPPERPPSRRPRSRGGRSPTATGAVARSSSGGTWAAGRPCTCSMVRGRSGSRVATSVRSVPGAGRMARWCSTAFWTTRWGCS